MRNYIILIIEFLSFFFLLGCAGNFRYTNAEVVNFKKYKYKGNAVIFGKIIVSPTIFTPSFKIGESENSLPYSVNTKPTVDKAGEYVFLKVLKENEWKLRKLNLSAFLDCSKHIELKKDSNFLGDITIEKNKANYIGTININVNNSYMKYVSKSKFGDFFRSKKKGNVKVEINVSDELTKTLNVFEENDFVLNEEDVVKNLMTFDNKKHYSDSLTVYQYKSKCREHSPMPFNPNMFPQKGF